MPAQSRGAAPARSRFAGTRRTKLLVDDDAVGVAAVGDASEVLVGEVVGEGHVRAELLEAGLALGAGAVRVDHAADGGEVAGLELGDGGADLGDAADDLMAGDAGVDGGHHARSTRCGPGGDRSGRCRRRGFRSARRVRLDRAARSWWRQAAMSHWQRNRLLRCTCT